MEGVKLVELLVSLEYEPQSYSGRGMYGETCLGIALPRDKSAFTLAAEVSAEAVDQLEDAHAFIRDLSMLKIRQDTLGHGIIVYFPSIPWTPEMTAAAP